MSLAFLAVDTASQGGGIGRAFVKEFLAKLQEAGIGRISLAVTGDNWPAKRLYGSTGSRLRLALIEAGSDFRIAARGLGICFATARV